MPPTTNDDKTPQHFNNTAVKMGWVVNASPQINDESQYPTIIAICCVLSVLSMAIVSCRLYIRATARGLASDDWMAALSMVFALVYSILCIVRKSSLVPAPYAKTK